jgi:hypothetical protein
MIMQKITIDHINNNSLITLMTQVSPYLKLNVDAFIIDYIGGSKYTAVPTGASGQYTIDISAKPRLYDPKIRQLFKTLSVKNPSDRLAQLISMTDAVNIILCQKSADPFKDPLCIAMAATAEPTLVTAVATAQSIKTNELAAIQQSDATKLASDCVQVNNLARPECIAYINSQISTNPNYDAPTVYMNVLIAATNVDGSLNKDLIDRYQGMKQWLIAKTADIVTTVNGVVKITSQCGGGISVDQCTKICEIYPEACVQDQVRKCSLPEHRYIKDGFCDCAAREDGTDWWWVLLIVMFVFIGAIGGVVWRKINMRRRHVADTTDTLSPDEADEISESNTSL